MMKNEQPPPYASAPVNPSPGYSTTPMMMNPPPAMSPPVVMSPQPMMQQPVYFQPPANTSSTTTSTNVNVNVGPGVGCPMCHNNRFRTGWTFCGWLWLLCCFPCGALCCLCCFSKKTCTKCGFVTSN